VSESWAAALEAAAAAPVTLVLGANDTGKSTLVTRLASALAGAGHTVGVVDADLGQSDVGPPTTVGLGRVGRSLERLADAELIGFEFLGVTSPATCMRETAAATGRLVRRALDTGCDRVLVDTSGLVEGRFGRALKRLKIDRVAPDVLVALQRAEECEPILRAYADAPRPAIVRLPAARTTRRSATVRRHARRRALEVYLAGAVPVTLDLTRVAARPAPASRGLAVIDVEGTLVGLETHDGCTLGLGWVRAIDAARGRLTVDTRVDGDRIAVVAIGRERYRAAAAHLERTQKGDTG
jgi:polynucleotide 5'-hydroxyl-kinase GRC3/NOL9